MRFSTIFETLHSYKSNETRNSQIYKKSKTKFVKFYFLTMYSQNVFGVVFLFARFIKYERKGVIEMPIKILIIE